MSDLLPRWLQPIGRPLAPMYARIIRSRNRRFDARRGVHKIDLPVISVGNITVGGTGKTPMVSWLARQLLDSGHHPCIAMRGYRARQGEIGDEQAEYHEQLRDVPVIADPNRHAALTAQLPNYGNIDCVLLDDGFQHRQLHRDLDLVLIDASRDTMHDRLLPAGSLREPLASLSRADAVIITRTDSAGTRELRTLDEKITRHHGRKPVAKCSHKWTALNVHEAAGSSEQPLDWLRGQTLMTMLGVGNPESIEQQIQQVGAKVVVNIPASDHERYDRPKLITARGLAEGVQATFMTGKDWVKVRALVDLKTWPTPIVVPRLELRFQSGEQSLRQMVLAAHESRS